MPINPQTEDRGETSEFSHSGRAKETGGTGGNLSAPNQIKRKNFFSNTMKTKQKTPTNGEFEVGQRDKEEKMNRTKKTKARGGKVLKSGHKKVNGRKLAGDIRTRQDERTPPV